MIYNYALSGWIANLGVVPLFSFAFFLFLPALVLFIFLRVLVCVVLEDIVYSLFLKMIMNYRRVYLSIFPILVKVFLLFSIESTLAEVPKQDHFLAKGEQMELSVENLKNFSVGNKEVLKYKFLPQKGKILIKGQKLGFSDLIVWSNQGKKQLHHFYVTSKREQLKKMEIAQILKNTALQTKISGDMIFIHGEVRKLKTYLLLKKLMQSKGKNLIFDTHLSYQLTTELIEKIYLDFYSQNANIINCRELNTQITCEISSKYNHKKLISFFETHYFVDFKYAEQLSSESNFLLKFKIISLESNKIKIRNFDSDKIDTKLNSLIQERKLFAGDSILLQDQDISLSLLAEPEVSLVFERPFKIQIGAEVPVPTRQGINGTTVEWKFVGLNIDGQLSIKEQNYLLNYHSFITQSQEANISGPKGDSSLYLKARKLTKLYSINIQREGLSETQTPFLASIPWLNSLFKKSSKQFGHKKVIVYAYLEEL